MKTLIASKEVYFEENEFIVSKTNLKGIITYTNDVFLKISGYSEEELLGKPHSIIRHPDMPKCVFRLMWSYLHENKEIFAYVKNRCKNGDYYWVLAHVTSSYDPQGNKIGYHSNRRKPSKESISSISEIYKELMQIELKAESIAQGMDKSTQKLLDILNLKGITYDEFMFSI